MTNKIERRSYELDELRIETREGKTPQLVGHAAVYNKLSENLGGFREQIKPGAFDDVMNDDVRALFNHDPNFPLGRTSAKTLRIETDKTGLRYLVDLPDTSYARDLQESINRGDISQSSFGFRVAPGGADWAEDADTGVMIRTITKFQRLYDVSPVVFPAYPQTDVAKRSLELFLDEKRKQETIDYSFYEKQLDLIEKF